jgi:outer membrane biosynthesis protein TonB
MNRSDERRETFAALVASVLIHLLLILGVAWFLLRAATGVVPPKPLDDEPVRLTILPPAPKPTPKPQFIATPKQENLERKPSKDAAFESDNDSLAASQAAPTGAEPLPSQDGHEEPGLQFQEQQYTAGKLDQPAVVVPQTQPAAAAAATEAPPEPEAKPTPCLTQDLALLEPPKPTPQPTAQPKPTPEKAAKATPARPPSPGGFQPETRITRLRGNISNRGRASVEANATPLGRYKKQVSDAIGSRWYYHVNSQMGLLNIGTVEIRFQVFPDGKVKSPRVLSNSSNESFASVSLAAVLQAEIPAIPPELVSLLENGRLEIDYSFTILGNR